MERSENSDGLNGHFNVNSLGETRSRLERLIMRIDNLEPSFDKMVEKTSMFFILDGMSGRKVV